MKINIVNDFTATDRKRFIIFIRGKEYHVKKPEESFALEEGESVIVAISFANPNFPDNYRVEFPESLKKMVKFAFPKPSFDTTYPNGKIQWKIKGGDELRPKWKLKIKNKTSKMIVDPENVTIGDANQPWPKP